MGSDHGVELDHEDRRRTEGPGDFVNDGLDVGSVTVAKGPCSEVRPGTATDVGYEVLDGTTSMLRLAECHHSTPGRKDHASIAEQMGVWKEASPIATPEGFDVLDESKGVEATRQRTSEVSN